MNPCTHRAFETNGCISKRKRGRSTGTKGAGTPVTGVTGSGGRTQDPRVSAWTRARNRRRKGSLHRTREG
eukprot:scaffold2682_cov344-Pavlova_lutheri.AAC.2